MTEPGEERVDARAVIQSYYEQLLDATPEQLKELAQALQRGLICVDHHQTTAQRDVTKLERDLMLLLDAEQHMHKLIYRIVDLATSLSVGKELFDAAQECEPSNLESVFFDVLAVARAIDGEGALEVAEPEECARWVAHSIVNRTEQAWWPSRAVQVVTQFYKGAVRVATPSMAAVRIALEVLDRDASVCPGVFFMVSEKDIQDHAWDDRRHVIVRSFWNEAHTAALHFAREWIGDAKPAAG